MDKIITNNRIQEIMDRLTATTPGNWERSGSYVFSVDDPESPLADCEFSDGDSEVNAEFIANAKADIKYLLNLVGSLSL